MKNASIKVKLLLATLPSLIILIVCLVFFAVAVNSTVKQSKQIYYDNLYTVSSNLNSADRDFYQALDASKSLFNMATFSPGQLSPELRKKYTDDYYSYDDYKVFITSGLGTYSPNLRLLNPPSINLYRLTNY